MKVHFLNCGTVRPRGARLAVPHLAVAPCNCLLVEAGEQLVLVDSGFGTLDMENPSRLGPTNLILNTRRDLEQTAARQIGLLGFRRDLVTDIVCTHLDRDHAGGLSDFPDARVHVTSAELEAALGRATRVESERYRKCHFSHGPRWVVHEEPAGPWFGLDRIRGLDGLPAGIILIPLPGHTRGHCGVAVETTRDRWLLHCGDAYYITDELRKDRPAPRGVRAFRRIAHFDFPRAMLSLERLKKVREETGGAIALIASHDPEGLSGVEGFIT
jgi:glyoxylase-like metal-dependent hydrolase (beta-lactamase superfamily II)